MNNQELYQKKQDVIQARRKLQRHGSSYDSTTTACFTFILLALAVAGASFFFMVVGPGDPTQFIMYVAYIAAGLVLLFAIIAIIVRIVHNRSRKPLVKAKKRLFSEYEQAIRRMLKYDYGLVPANDDEFTERLLADTYGDSDSVVIQAVTLDGQDRINLTLKEVDDDALILTKYGVPYRMSSQVEEILEPMPEPLTESMPEQVPEPMTQPLAAPVKNDTNPGESISISELFRREGLQNS